MTINFNLNFAQIAKQYSDEQEAYKFLESIRWENGVFCPHCGYEGANIIPNNIERKTSTGKTTFRRVWKCADCKKQFSVLVGTIFEDSKIPLSKWLLAIHELNADKNGISSCELGRKLGITQKSAWFMLQRLRFAVSHSPLEDKLNNEVEADETYIGGLESNKHKSKRTEGTQGRSTKTKTPVFSVIERGGSVFSTSLKAVSSKNLKEVLQEKVSFEATLNTDMLASYNEPGKMFAAHNRVDHNIDEYVNGTAYTNNAEGFFSQLKRSLSGTFHHVSEKHLDRYLAEFDFRYNTRKQKDGARMIRSIQQTEGKRLTYKVLIGKMEEVENE